MPDYGPDPQVAPYLLYEDAGAAMDWLVRVFGFTERVRDQLSDGTGAVPGSLRDGGAGDAPYSSRYDRSGSCIQLAGTSLDHAEAVSLTR